MDRKKWHRKSVLAKTFTKTVKNKSYKYLTSICYIDKLDDIVNKSNNTYHGTFKTNSVDVKSSTYIDSSEKNWWWRS